MDPHILGPIDSFVTFNFKSFWCYLCNFFSQSTIEHPFGAALVTLPEPYESLFNFIPLLLGHFTWIYFELEAAETLFNIVLEWSTLFSTHILFSSLINIPSKCCFCYHRTIHFSIEGAWVQCLREYGWRERDEAVERGSKMLGRTPQSQKGNVGIN